MTWKTCAERTLCGDGRLPGAEIEFRRTAVDATLEFGRFRMLLRRRQLLAEGAPIELGSRAFDLLLALVEAGGSLVSKGELITRVWPGIIVSEENLKVQISALRKALGEDRDFIRTESGRGYRFTASIRWSVRRNSCRRPTRHRLRRESGFGSIFWPPHRRSVRNQSGGRLDAAQG
jgi:DNA-binding winged helix-turn-helix (wHTH) protein